MAFKFSNPVPMIESERRSDRYGLCLRWWPFYNGRNGLHIYLSKPFNVKVPLVIGILGLFLSRRIW